MKTSTNYLRTCKGTPEFDLPKVHAMVAGLLVWLAGAFLATAQVDDFNDGNDNGWVRNDPIQEALLAFYGPPQPPFATWSFINGGYRIQAEVSPDPSNLGPARSGSYWTNAIYTYTNFYVSVDVLPWGTNVNQAAGILGRVQSYSGGGATYAYTLTYEPYARDFQITSFQGGGFVPLIAEKVDLTATNTHRIVFTGVGEELEGRIYVLPETTTPVATISATDSAFTEGWCGLLTFSLRNEATDVTYDNYMALLEPPPSLTVSLSGNDVLVSWPILKSSYSLQSTTVLPASSWTTITSGITQADGRNNYTTSAVANTFYRLKLN